MSKQPARDEFSTDKGLAASPSSIPPARVRRSVIFLGLGIICANSYWTHWAGHRDAYTPWMSMWSFFPNVISMLFVFSLGNYLLLRRGSRHALRPQELLVLFIMILVSTSLSAGDFQYYLAPMISYWRWAMERNTQWADLLRGVLPPHLVVGDLRAVEGLFVGNSSFYRLPVIRAWLGPLLWWSFFLGLVWLAMYCINRLLLSRWADQERLAFPLAIPPMLVSVEARNILTDRLVWIGIALPFTLSVVDVFKQVWPAVPTIPVWIDLAPALGRAFPWSAQRALIVEVTPVTIGLTYLVPRELSMSLWLFNLLWRATAILGAQYGLTVSDATFPFYNQNSMGGAIALVLATLWLSRRYLRNIFERTLRPGQDRAEASALRLALLGLLVSGTLLTIFLLKSGMSPLIGLGFLALFFITSLAASRLRSQAGPPSVELSMAGTIPDIAGTLHLSRAEVGLMALMFPLTYSTRSMPMGIQMEGMYLASRAGIRRMGTIILLSGIVAIVSTFWSALDFGYRLGISSGKANVWACDMMVPSWYTGLVSWLQAPTQRNPAYLGALGVGALITVVLSYANSRIPGWPLHPAGFVLGSSYFIHIQFPAIFLGWLMKTLIIRYGGVRAHHRAVGFFTGMIIGACLGIMLELFSLHILRELRQRF